jgi:AraC family transcriptional regulator, regulatory protein of adaptative response / methylated-DNA-[protein]-cysteine methyltransferase
MEHSMPRYATDHERWLAVTSRDTRADGLFVYSVRTTGVYSRPSCLARLARRENVVFFETAREARRAGFRPCRRCKPDGPTLSDEYTEAVTKACRAIDRAQALPSLDDLAAAAGFSRFHFHRVFKAVTGVTPGSYCAALRAERVWAELTQASTVTEAIYSAGFNSNGHFYETSLSILGMTPTDFRSGGIGTRIRYRVAPCSLGWILVAAADRGVCTILFGDAPRTLTDQLARRFARAELTDRDVPFAAAVERAVEQAEHTVPAGKLPRDVYATILRQLVADTLRGAGAAAPAAAARPAS